MVESEADLLSEEQMLGCSGIWSRSTTSCYSEYQ